MPEAQKLQAEGLIAYISGKARTPMLQVIYITFSTLKIYPNLWFTALPSTNKFKAKMDLIHYSFKPLILFCVPYMLDLLP